MTDEQANTIKHNVDIDPITLCAIDWMVRLESGLATAEDQQNFQIWLQQDTSHQQAWQELQQGIDLPFQQLQQHSLDAELPIKAVTQSVLKTNLQRIKYMVKGGISLVLIMGLSTVIWLQQTRPLSFFQADYYTRIAEQIDIQLEDGSTITLAAYSAIKVEFTPQKRDIYLLDGALIANVSADKNRPFTVHTQHAKMQALGTEFMAQQHKGFSDLAVLEHRVKADNSQQFEIVEQGYAVRIDHHQIQSLKEPAKNLASWKDGILHVEDMSLSEFIQLLKPYHQGSIYLDDDIKNLKVYGVFYLHDTNKILQILQTTQPVKVYKNLGMVYISKSDEKHPN